MTRRPRLALTAVAVAAGLTLSGCGSDDAGTGSTGPREAAAVVDGRTVSIGEVQSATQVVNRFIQERGGQTTLTNRDVLGTLMLSPQILERAREAKMDVPSAGTVRSVLEQMKLEPSDSAVEFIRAQTAREGMGQSDLEAVAQALGDAEVKVNPRYGHFDGQAGLTAAAPNWLEPLPEQLAPGHSAGDGHNH